MPEKELIPKYDSTRRANRYQNGTKSTFKRQIHM